MREIVVVLACLACVGQGRRLEYPSKHSEEAFTGAPALQLNSRVNADARPSAWKAFGMLLLALNPAIAFCPSGLGAASALCGCRRVATARRCRLRSSNAAKDAVPAMEAATASVEETQSVSSPSKFRQWFVKHRSVLLVMCVVMHKCTTDGLTRYTRLAGDYAGSTVAIMAEMFKFPLIACAIAAFGGGASQIKPVFREALTTRPFARSGISFCYTFDNLLYFGALSSLSVIAYQVLSLSKTIFTAGLMYLIVGKRLIPRQILAIVMLVAGALLVQLQELTKSHAATSVVSTAAAAATGPGGMSPVLWGSLLVLFANFMSALPNVAYERVLKTEGENQWVNNIKVTIWIMFWVSMSKFVVPTIKALLGLGAAAGTDSVVAGLSLGAVRAAFTGFTPAVWGVCLLKSLNGILISATFKYADNIQYSYAKPAAIVVTTVLTYILAQSLPPPTLVAGVATVVASIFLYSSKPKKSEGA